MRNSRFIRALTVVFIAAFASGVSCSAQVRSVSRIRDPQSQLLQQQYAVQLQAISSEAATLRFPYPFYFSDTLDVDEARQKQLPSGSIHFDNFHGERVLAITGNYFVSYSGTLLTANLRARKTFQDVVLPLLRIAVAHTNRSVPIGAYAFEIAHHVRTNVMKVSTEGPENLMLLIPRTMAEKIVKTKNAEAKNSDLETQQSALLESEVFLNGEPFTLWLTGDDAPTDVNEHYLARRQTGAALALNARQNEAARQAEPGTMVNPSLLPESPLLTQIRDRAKIPPNLSSARMESLEVTYGPVVQRLSADLKEQARFVPYAPPAFIGFRDGAYLELNLSTELEQGAGSSGGSSGSSLYDSSQYRSAALAFDQHIAHLLRPVSKYFPENPQFEGIDFSTTVRQGAQSTPVSVEFVAPFSALTCYEKYDCTGQELINRSVVLINGERVTLDLQRAESSLSARVP
ncbi:MAG TPA: hypothetical protein VN176_13250 [Verrucomicrobiae bacterium]|nr:hypothetical protein [Verrucomicrobiae bacterium]